MKENTASDKPTAAAAFRKRSSRFQLLTQHGDVFWRGLIAVTAIFVLVLVLAIGWTTWRDSALSREVFGLSFVLPTADASWNPVTDTYDAWPLIAGTIVTSVFAILIAAPFSIFIAIFLSELCPMWLRTPANFVIEMLAAIPSVVLGLWGIFVFLPSVVVPVGHFLENTLGFLPLFQGPIPASGSSRLAAVLILTIMIIPTITALTRDVLRAIPDSQREAALALGSTRWETIWQVLIPASLSGIFGAVILGLGRALGETMAVTMVIGNNTVEASGSLLRPGATLASTIANQFAEAVSPMHSSALIELGLILFVITLLLNMAARLLVYQVQKKVPTEARA